MLDITLGLSKIFYMYVKISIDFSSLEFLEFISKGPAYIKEKASECFASSQFNQIGHILSSLIQQGQKFGAVVPQRFPNMHNHL
jgi:hypothetical protein